MISKDHILEVAAHSGREIEPNLLEMIVYTANERGITRYQDLYDWMHFTLMIDICGFMAALRNQDLDMISKDHILEAAAHSGREIEPNLIEMIVYTANEKGITRYQDLYDWMHFTLLIDISAFISTLETCIAIGYDTFYDTVAKANASDAGLQAAADEACLCDPKFWRMGLTNTSPSSMEFLQGQFQGPLLPDTALPETKYYINAYLAHPILLNGISTPAVLTIPQHRYQGCVDLLDRLQEFGIFSSIEIHEHPPRVSPLLLRFYVPTPQSHPDDERCAKMYEALEQAWVRRNHERLGDDD